MYARKYLGNKGERRHVIITADDGIIYLYGDWICCLQKGNIR
jgi:hypothetical protein